MFNNILQLDYNPGPAGSPTLRQMIMGLTTGSEDAPLFHSVDLDWKGIGYVFQYAPEHRSLAECTIHTLFPLLQHHYPECSLHGNFTQETISRCKNMRFDEVTGTIIDPDAEESMKYMEEANLPGFHLDMSLLEQNNSTNTDNRPAARTGFPSDNDSVSTIGNGNIAIDRNSRNTSSTGRTVNLGTSNAVSDDATIQSNISTVTTETIQTIQTQLHVLQQQVQNTDSKFNELMNFLRQGSGTSHETTSQIGTSTVVNLDTGEGATPLSGGVP